MGCVDFTQLKWPSQTWVFEGASSITNSIFLLSSNIKRCAHSDHWLGHAKQSEAHHVDTIAIAFRPGQPAERLFFRALSSYSDHILG
jgi:hypothetical protein